MGFFDTNPYDSRDARLEQPEEPQGGKAVVAGRELVCPVCGCKSFWQRETQLNTSGMTFLGLDWANISAQNYVCNDCGYMFWFYPRD